MRSNRRVSRLLSWSLSAAVMVLSWIGPATAQPAAAEIRAAGAPSLALVADDSAATWAVRVDGAARGGLPTTVPSSAQVDTFRAAGEGWLVTAVDGPGRDARFHLARGTADGAEALPVPATTPGALLAEPTPVASADADKALDASLEGLVWLEGHDHRSLSVRAARWTGAGWTTPVTVAPPGPGTQIALDVARLADGSWLAVWAGFDGVDDEIVWSRFDGAEWSAPAAVSANGVPDVTPTLRAQVEGGALVAWSGYDGADYRLHVARFDGDAWGTPRTVGGRGAALPRFAESPTPVVVYRQAVPRRWVLAELGADALPQRSAGVALGAVRPQVLAVTGAGVTIAWPDVQNEATKAAPTTIPWDL
ncbi:MAG: hypothetical protein AAGC60_25115 [Acidobacteriota bacterium]